MRLIKCASIECVVTHADGRREDLGMTNYWHRSVLKRMAKRFILARNKGLYLSVSDPIGALTVMIPIFLFTGQTNAGQAIVTNRIKGAGTEPVYQAWGLGGAALSAASTALSTEDSGGSPAYARVAGTSTQQTTTNTNDTYQVVATLTSNGTKTITNAGLFDASTVGNMYFAGDGLSVALILNDTITFTNRVQYT